MKGILRDTHIYIILIYRGTVFIFDQWRLKLREDLLIFEGVLSSALCFLFFKLPECLNNVELRTKLSNHQTTIYNSMC